MSEPSIEPIVVPEPFKTPERAWLRELLAQHAGEECPRCGTWYAASISMRVFHCNRSECWPSMIAEKAGR
jgi:hypothetical protein